MKMKTKTVSKSLDEVWEWKEEVYNDIKDKDFEGKKKYFKEGLDSAVKLLNGKLVKNSDGSYNII